MNAQDLLLTFLGSGAAHCVAAVEEHGSLIATLFFTGLLGSVTHCVGMCGPFVVAQAACRLEDVPAAEMREWHRVKGGLLAPYHLGRMTTYAALGGVAGGLFGMIPAGRAANWAGAALLALAALGFLGYALPRLGLKLPFRLGADSLWVRGIDRIVRPLFARPVGWRGYGLGVALGFIPCGLVYAALAAAAASGEALGGLFAMAAFAAGTMPALIGLGMIGGWAADRFRAWARRLLPMLFLVNAAVLLALAWSLAARPVETIGGPFALTGPHHETVTDADFKGRVLIVYFGYTFCPDVCPTSLANIADAIDLLTPEEQEKVAAVYISVDPDRDTPEALAEYTSHFHEKITGLTGSPAAIAAAAKAYSATYARVEGQGAAEYLMDHSTAIYLMDADGRFIRHFAHTVEPRLLARALKTAIGKIR
ncbi:SCO family protein [Oleispirillum naphthae]|uniref:SCO family protein n=1 Tax=Oleispirillum naphthae TaxID=2838853 RepID=UPI00308240FF